jgi:hypothetical protein
LLEVKSEEGSKMTLEGTVVNGVIVPDAKAHLPEGARVWIELAGDDDDLFPAPEPYDREKELAILRESIEDMKAGRGTDARELLKELAEKCNLPLAPGE